MEVTHETGNYSACFNPQNCGAESAESGDRVITLATTVSDLIWSLGT